MILGVVFLALCLGTHMVWSPELARAQAKEVIFSSGGPSYPEYAEGLGLNMYLSSLVGLTQVHPDLKGKINIKIADKGALYSTQNDALTAVSSGAIQMTYSGPHFLEQLDPAWKLGEAPGVFDSWEHFMRTMETPAWKELHERMAKDKNVTIVKWLFDTGIWYLFTSKGAVKNLDDIKGQRIRFAGGEAFAKALKAMGVNSVALPFSEVVTALQTNMVDGVLTDMTGGMYFYNLERYCPHLVLVPWAIQPVCMVVSTKWYQGLDPKVRDALNSPFERIDLSKFYLDFQEISIKKWAAGQKTKAYALEKAESDRWQKIMKDAVQDMLAGIDPKYVQAVEQTRKK